MNGVKNADALLLGSAVVSTVSVFLSTLLDLTILPFELVISRFWCGGGG